MTVWPEFSSWPGKRPAAEFAFDATTMVAEASCDGQVIDDGDELYS